MEDLGRAVDQVAAETGFSGVVRADVAGRTLHAAAFWLHPTGDAVVLEGADAGVSFRSVHDPVTATTHTVLSNTTDGAWPVARRLSELLGC